MPKWYKSTPAFPTLPGQLFHSQTGEPSTALQPRWRWGKARTTAGADWAGVLPKAPGSSGLCDNAARWSVVFTHAQQASSEILSLTLPKCLQQGCHILHVLFLLPSPSKPQPTNSWTLQSTPNNRAKLDRATSERGDTCWAWEHPTTGGICTGLWTHHFLLSHKWAHFGFTFLRTFIRGLALIFLGTSEDLGETAGMMNLLWPLNFPHE